MEAQAIEVARELARAQAEERARQDAIAADDALKRRILQNGKLIEADQKLWEEELTLERNREKAAEDRHKRKQERKKEEQRMEQILINQKRDAIRTTIQAAVSAAQAGKASFETQKKIAAAQALVNAYLAISDVWADDDSNYYVKLAKVASAAAQVFGVVSSLRSVSVGGGGGGGVSTTAPAQPSVPGSQDSLLQQDGTPSQNGGGQTTIVFQGGTFIGGDKDELAREMVPPIQQALQDGQR